MPLSNHQHGDLSPLEFDSIIEQNIKVLKYKGKSEAIGKSIDTISNGDVLYSDSACTTPWNGASNFYRIYQGGFYGCQIGAFGTVSNLLNCSVSPTPTPTPTPTSSPTPPPFLYSFSIWIGGSGSSGTACQMTGAEYTVYNEVGYLLDGGIVYTDGLGTTVFVGHMYYYSDGSTVGRISNGGLYTQETNCAL